MGRTEKLEQRVKELQEFAKKRWGEGGGGLAQGGSGRLGWESHLALLVNSDNPEQYLEENL